MKKSELNKLKAMQESSHEISRQAVAKYLANNQVASFEIIVNDSALAESVECARLKKLMKLGTLTQNGKLTQVATSVAAYQKRNR